MPFRCAEYRGLTEYYCDVVASLYSPQDKSILYHTMLYPITLSGLEPRCVAGRGISVSPPIPRCCLPSLGQAVASGQAARPGSLGSQVQQGTAAMSGLRPGAMVCFWTEEDCS